MDLSTSFSNLIFSQFGYNGDEFGHHFLAPNRDLELLRYAVGIIGNVVSILLYAAPIITFRRVIEKKSTGEFSCIPYVSALLNCIIYTWYGSPLVSRGWENLSLVTINGVGIALELSFISIYFWYSSPRGRKLVTLIMAPLMFAMLVVICCLTFELEDRLVRKAIVGSIGLVVSIAMYGSPLVAVERVLRTKSVEYMPFNLSLFSFLTSLSWLVYGLLGNDILLASPNFLGVPLGILQLVVYFINRGETEIVEQPIKIYDIKNVSSFFLTTPLITEILDKDDNNNDDGIKDI
ncbi:hypothetical protein MKW98_017146 [Papaver atlanticum]|uniref:Bidirectional sugar transporter SWEET n=1 Tax=Papaver atlanticum TaxID=357466 RepID=A0AAD4TJY1_9MAGN|nr:hypothetical protein MKW98_017146 [Papaver atlanticum]